ncbi:electron transfer flavoprotein subunit beta/FixA family protein [Agilicoccus flavus]|uniref:electron transfer flavoprotein subunit beta/FixA family protein n=1 Tax=Agilicoccus flavus TaxID=2775968 RepID=UPI001CF67DAB|nr:electron transfer flavoprotein subunit beta/FixA family protein [Agilicoccus flavus]
MTDVLVCVKRVPDASGEVVLTPDGSRVDGRYAGYTMSAHEECAVEIGVKVAEATGGAVTVLTLGDEDSVEQLRAALSVGAAEAVRVDADADAYGPADVAREIAAVVTTRAGAGKDYDLVLLGNDAADTGDFQVGIRLAYALDRPVVTGVQRLEVSEGTATMQVDNPEGTEIYEVALPAVATVLEGGVSPRYPSITGKIKAKKAPLETVEPSAAPAGSGRQALRVPPPPPTQVEILGEGPAAAPRLVEVLTQLGAGR